MMVRDAEVDVEVSFGVVVARFEAAVVNGCRNVETSVDSEEERCISSPLVTLG
jgi:hypothetical protein